MTTGRELVVLFAGREIGRVRKETGDRLIFTYADAWRHSPNAVPLSLSMPLVTASHRHTSIETYLWGLLPDNELVLDRWARKFQVSARNAFALIAHVGEDCAGAVQFARPERLAALTTAGAEEVEWLDEAEVADRLRTLRIDRAAWRMPRDTGQFSLAGAQPKTALLHRDGRWGIPAGRTPTTHILKPPTGEFDGHAENEHFCLLLARKLGLPAATSQVQRFGEEIAIVIERYDRAYTREMAAAAAAEAAAKAAEAATWTGDAATPDARTKAAAAAAGAAAAAARAQRLADLAKFMPILRLHQEDLCQALGVMPTSKYQNEGGPSPKDIASLIEAHSSRPREDVRTFVDALIFNWLIAGTDAHAKNYSLLHGGGGQIRLAPLYDLASALPYPEFDPQRLKLAMKMGGEYRLRDIGPRQWRKFAEELKLKPGGIVERAADLASQLPQHVEDVRNDIRARGLEHAILDRLATMLTARSEQCRRSLLAP
ncbi:MAG: type II toxin-antitoxin system HipA family toxin [Rhodospirillaceae bacterium]|nr:type II toxin-antitoxin system HipA family toxin [Rhodospirillaceae bacterium]